MKKRIINWAIKKLINFSDSSSNPKEQVKGLIFKLYDLADLADYKALDIEILAFIFDAKYTEDGKAAGLSCKPSEELSRYYNIANKGDASFISEPFYRVLTKRKDKEVLSLRYRLKISQ